MTAQHDLAASTVTPPRTGVAGVDDALDEVAICFAGPVEEQVPAVERAHERLRAALDDIG